MTGANTIEIAILIVVVVSLLLQVAGRFGR